MFWKPLVWNTVLFPPFALLRFAPLRKAHLVFRTCHSRRSLVPLIISEQKDRYGWRCRRARQCILQRVIDQHQCADCLDHLYTRVEWNVSRWAVSKSKSITYLWFSHFVGNFLPAPRWLSDFEFACIIMSFKTIYGRIRVLSITSETRAERRGNQPGKCRSIHASVNSFWFELLAVTIASLNPSFCSAAIPSIAPSTTGASRNALLS